MDHVFMLSELSAIGALVYRHFMRKIPCEYGAVDETILLWAPGYSESIAFDAME